MKMKKRFTALTALLLLTALALPILASCSSGGLEIPTEEEIFTETAGEMTPSTIVATQEETSTEEEVVDPSLGDPNWNYIPPENYIDYSDNESLKPTENIGNKGSAVTTGGNPVMSFASYLEYQKATAITNHTVAIKRDRAEAEMRAMLSVRWTPAEDTLYSYNRSAYVSREVQNEEFFAQDQINLKAGKIYQGLPYTHGSSNAAAFLYGATAENGLYTVKVNTHILSGDSNSSHPLARWGNDAEDALFWAWAPVAITPSFTTTAQMTEKYGVLPVGEYALTEDQKASIANATDDIVLANGKDVMFASYEKLQKADGLVADTDDKDHAMMVVSVNVVKNEDGSINADASTVTVLEQTDANLASFEALSEDEKAAKAGEALVIGNLDKAYTFTQLFEGGFLPITCEELNKDGALPHAYGVDSYRASSQWTEGNLFKGMYYFNRRPQYVVMTVKNNSTGVVVMESCSFPREAAKTADGLFQFDPSKWTAGKEASYRVGSVIASNVEKGLKVKVTLTAYFADGTEALLRTTTFTG